MLTQLRVRGDELPLKRLSNVTNELIIGAAPECDLRIGDADGGVSRRHAKLVRSNDVWTIHDLGSTNGVFQDGERRMTFEVTPGVEIDIGGITLIAESARLLALRDPLSRAIGWSTKRRLEVDRALRAVRDMANRRSSMVLCGDGDLGSFVGRVHQLAFGDASPFVVCDAEVEPLLPSAAGGLLFARGGDKLPGDIVDAIDPEADVRLVVACETLKDARAAIAAVGRSELVELPSIASRANELDRLVNEYAADAVQRLGATAPMFREHEMTWIRASNPTSLDDVETTALRIVALRNWGVNAGAEKLGISHAALSRWASRRKIPT
jgi:hypothetical protein